MSGKTFHCTYYIQCLHTDAVTVNSWLRKKSMENYLKPRYIYFLWSKTSTLTAYNGFAFLKSCLNISRVSVKTILNLTETIFIKLIEFIWKTWDKE
jgi:hypothetical protein